MALDMLTFGRFSLLAAVLAPSFWAGAGWAAPSLAGLAAGWAMADFTPKLLSACATATRIYKIINTNA
jgi:hypothetical protein